MGRNEAYAVDADKVTAGKVVVDGAKEPRRWSTLTVGVGAHQPNDETLGTGTVLFQAELIHGGGRKVRRFALQAYESVALDFSPYDNARVVILAAENNNHRVYAVFSELPVASRVETAFYPAAVEAGTHVTPWGAVSVCASTADPGFAWAAYDVDGNLISVADPFAANEAKIVRGPLFVSSITTFSALWEVEL